MKFFSLWQRLRNYLLQSSIHGLKYLVIKNLHFIERIIWLIAILVSCYWMASFIHQQVGYFQNNSLNFGVRTDYLYWNYEFPSVTYCFRKNSELLLNYNQLDYWMDPDEIKKLISDKDIANLMTSLPDLKYIGYWKRKCSQSNWDKCLNREKLSALARKISLPCKELLVKCLWNDIEFDCCEYFYSIDTPLGNCYTINNYNSRVFHKHVQFYPMILNNTYSNAVFTIIFKNQGRFFLHDRKEYPNILAASDESSIEMPKNNYTFEFTMSEIISDDQIRGIPLDQRKCRFSDETYSKKEPQKKIISNPNINKEEASLKSSYENRREQPYSIAYCLDHCRAKLEMERCNCSSAFSGIEKTNECNLRGMSCLSVFQMGSLMSSNYHYDNPSGFNCTCEFTCNSIETKHLNSRKLGPVNPGGNYEVNFKLIQPPILRYERSLTRNALDMVVSIGGLGSLFIGASILSFLEIIYFLFNRLSNSQLETDEKENKVKRQNFRRNILL